MMFLERTYERSPIWLQDVFCTLYGMHQRWTYYGGDFQRYDRAFAENEHRAAAQLSALQLERLRAMLAHASRHVRHYGYLRDVVDASSKGLDWHAFAGIPILEKATLREASREFVADNVPRRSRRVFQTSGTTGTPLTVVLTRDALSQLWAAMERLRAWAGVSRKDRRASLTGKVFVPTGRDPKGVYWRYDYAGRRLLLSVYHLNDRTVGDYARALRDFAPAFIDGYPSAMRRIAAHMEAHPAERAPSLRAAFPTAETLTPETRAVIERGFGARVFNQYGSTEVSAHVGECAHGNMHVSPEIGVVEIVDRNGKPAAPGEVGDLVLTGLVNRAMPLIRYRIGDMAIVRDPADPCPCGRTLPLIGDIVGRNDDLVRTPDGRLLPIMNYHMMKFASGVKESLLVQEDLRRFTLFVVPDRQAPLELRRAIAELETRMACPVDLDVVQVAALPASERGKLRSVVSKVAA